MIFKSSNPDLKTIMDYFRTGKYGEEEYPDKVLCSRCGATIRRGEDLYIVKDTFFCMDCAEAAEGYILDCYRDRFIYEL